MLISRLVLRQLNVTVRPKTVRRLCAIWRAPGEQKVDQITHLMRRSQPPTETPRGSPRGAACMMHDDVVRNLQSTSARNIHSSTRSSCSDSSFHCAP
jgi:hypothetical protein